MPGNFLEIQRIEDHDAQVGFRLLAEEINAEAQIIVTEAADMAAEFLRQESPIGQTGNLSRAWISTVGTPTIGAGGRFQAGTGWEARARIKKGTVFPQDMVTMTRKGPYREKVDPPNEYALAVSEGRRSLSIFDVNHRPGAAGNLFIWNRGSYKPHVAFALRSRLGDGFIGRAQYLTDAWVAARTRSFLSRVARSTPASRARRKYNLSFPGT